MNNNMKMTLADNLVESEVGEKVRWMWQFGLLLAVLCALVMMALLIWL
jgi:hypothetical protein